MRRIAPAMIGKVPAFDSTMRSTRKSRDRLAGVMFEPPSPGRLIAEAAPSSDENRTRPNIEVSEARIKKRAIAMIMKPKIVGDISGPEGSQKRRMGLPNLRSD